MARTSQEEGLAPASSFVTSSIPLKNSARMARTNQEAGLAPASS
jgi:hypothetical protein